MRGRGIRLRSQALVHQVFNLRPNVRVAFALRVRGRQVIEP